jgi:hypothetical protein
MYAPRRGAPRDVLQEITVGIQAGRLERSYLDLSVEAGYSVTAVVNAVRMLEEQGFIRVVKQGRNRPHRYEVLTEEKRRTLVVARLLGLIR